MTDESLSNSRREIDRIDEEILRLLSQRANRVVEIGKRKESLGLPVYAPDREQKILERLRSMNEGPLRAEAIRDIFQEIIGNCRSLERGVKVAYLGPEATFSHQAARRAMEDDLGLLAAKKHFGMAPQFVPTCSIAGVFDEVSHERADFGVVPIENSTVGTLNETLDLFALSNLKICAEIYLCIHQYLLSQWSMDQVERIFSKDAVFPQCRAWLDRELPRAERVDVASTGEGVRRALAEPHSAAIAGKLAAEMFGIRVLADRIEDDPDNATRFFVISRDPQPVTGNDKTSIVLAIRDKVGALYDVLYPFKTHGVNLTKIESRPSRLRPWDYYFFLDFLGHWEDEGPMAAIGDIRQEAMFVKWLGSYVVGSKVS